MRIDVAFTPAEAGPAHVAIVVDVMRATSTIAQALASGYRRVLCCGEIDDARALGEQLGDNAVVGGEREAVQIAGFDLGASPRDYLEPRAETAILTTTNGTRTTLAAAANAEHVLLGSLLNLDAVAAAAREPGEDITVVCAGYQGAFAIDDAYCAGRIVSLLDGERTDAAVASAAIARAYPTACEGVNARTYGPPGLEDDLRWCTQENTLSVVPRFTRMVGPAAEITG
jgi:2-phosphosulfolactate phosphatase